jgi:hypothetical protein
MYLSRCSGLRNGVEGITHTERERERDFVLSCQQVEHSCLKDEPGMS